MFIESSITNFDSLTKSATWRSTTPLEPRSAFSTNLPEKFRTRSDPKSHSSNWGVEVAPKPKIFCRRSTKFRDMSPSIFHANTSWKPPNALLVGSLTLRYGPFVPTWTKKFPCRTKSTRLRNASSSSRAQRLEILSTKAKLHSSQGWKGSVRMSETNYWLALISLRTLKRWKRLTMMPKASPQNLIWTYSKESIQS